MHKNSYRHIDPYVLLSAVANDMDAFRAMAATYLRTNPPMLERLSAAAAAGNAEAIMGASHALKGTAALIGAARLTQLAESIEKRARTGDATVAGILLAELQQEFHHVISEVQTAISQFHDDRAADREERRR